MSPRRRGARSTPTPDEIWRILRGTAREARVAKRRYDDLMRRIAAEKAEQEKRFREAEEERRRREAELAERDRAMEREIYRLYGAGDNRWGKVVEGLVEGNLLKLFRDTGVAVGEVVARVRSHRLDESREYDLVAYGESDTLVVEVKATLEAADVRRFTARMRDFRQWRPDHARERIRGALAYLTTEGRAARRADTAGFYRIEAISGTARIVNSEGFQPRFF